MIRAAVAFPLVKFTPESAMHFVIWHFGPSVGTESQSESDIASQVSSTVPPQWTFHTLRTSGLCEAVRFDRQIDVGIHTQGFGRSAFRLF